MSCNPLPAVRISVQRAGDTATVTCLAVSRTGSLGRRHSHWELGLSGGERVRGQKELGGYRLSDGL